MAAAASAVVAAAASTAHTWDLGSSKSLVSVVGRSTLSCFCISSWTCCSLICQLILTYSGTVKKLGGTGSLGLMPTPGLKSSAEQACVECWRESRGLATDGTPKAS